MKSIKDIYNGQKLDQENNSEFWCFAIPLIRKIQNEGAFFIIKADGERVSDIFTVLLQGGKLNDDFYRCDTDDLEQGVNNAISYYAEKIWI